METVDAGEAMTKDMRIYEVRISKVWLQLAIGPAT